MTPAIALGIADHMWTLGELIDSLGSILSRTNKEFFVIMAHVAAKIQRIQLFQSVDTAGFEKELTDASRKYGIGITGSVTLFVMEPEDFERKYVSNSESSLDFV